MFITHTHHTPHSSVMYVEYCKERNQLNLNAKRVSAAKAENEQSGETYL